MGADPIYKDTDIFLGNYEILIDYQDLFLSAIGNYFANTGDIESLRPYWEQIKALVVARLRYIDPYSGLMAGAEAYYFLGPVNGSAVTALSAYTLGRLVPLAEALGDDGAAILYSDTAANLSRAINSRLWNPSTGVYSLSIDAPSNFSLTAIAWTILSGTANASQAASMISKLPSLRLGIGYKTNSGDADSNTTQLSPNTQGFLLEALFKAQRDLGVQNVTVARTLLNDFWAQMVIQDQYYSGASWVRISLLNTPYLCHLLMSIIKHFRNTSSQTAHRVSISSHHWHIRGVPLQRMSCQSTFLEFRPRLRVTRHGHSSLFYRV